MQRSTFKRTARLPAGGLLLAACATGPPALEAPAPASPETAPGAAVPVLAPVPAPAGLGGPGRDQEAAGSLEAIHELLDRGEVQAAWRALGGRLLADHLDRAREQIEQGRLLDALEEYDGALALDPRHLEALLGRGEACLAIGSAGNDPFFLEDGRANLVKAARLHDVPRAWLAASRASRLAFDYAQEPDRRGTMALDALEQARRGAALAEGQHASAVGEFLPQRVHAEGAFRAWLAAREGLLQASPENLFKEVEDNLMATLGARPADPWPYLQLANLYQWEGRLDASLHSLLRGLSIRPDDVNLLERLAAVGRELGGRARLIEIYEKLVAEHPDEPVVLRLVGLEVFWLAMDELDAGRGNAELFRRAQAAFRRCREVDAAFTDEATGWEITCCNGLGYALFHANDLEGARQAFLSMEALREGGLTWELGERLPSGLLGLSFIVDRLAQDVNVSTMEADNLESLEKAAAISDFLHAYDPERPEWANNAGFFNRDFAFALETSAQAQLHEAQRTASSVASMEARESALARLARARELMERSFAAYVVAARLSSEDVRVVNDTGLILTYYLQRDVDIAEDYLQSAVSIGERKLEARAEGEDMDEDELYNLLNAWGDAHQNLGVLYLTLKNDPTTARNWFEKAVEIGPDPREAITMPRGYLAQCALATAGEFDPATLRRWGTPPAASNATDSAQ